MPTLMNSTNGAQYKTAYKKALSVLSQAVVLNVALDDYDMSQATETSAAKATDGSSASLYNLFNNRMNVVKTATTGTGWKASNNAKLNSLRPVTIHCSSMTVLYSHSKTMTATVLKATPLLLKINATV